MNLFAFFRRHFPADLSRPFLFEPGGPTYSYGDLMAESARIASLLRALGVRPGDRVAVQVEKSPRALFLYLACLRTGAVYLPLNTAYPPGEVEYFLQDAEPSAVIVSPAAQPALSALTDHLGIAHLLTLDEHGEGTLVDRSRALAAEDSVVERGPDDVAAILYSSGTTGRPKGAMLTHRNLASNAATLCRLWGFSPTDVLLHALPIFHTHGLFVACSVVMLSGSAMHFLPKLDLDLVVPRLAASTVFMGVPTYYTRLLADPRITADATAALRLFVSGSAPLLTETALDFRQRTGKTILERYGMTETGMLTSNPLDGERRIGSVGFPLPDVELAILDDDDRPLAPDSIGQIAVRGPNVFKGYWRMPEKTAAEFTGDGFFRTGDLGRVDEDGYVHIVGRAKDLIISGGYNVYPKEVELVLDAFAGVAESAVVGMPHPDFGEAGLAVIVPRDAEEAPEAQAILGYLKQHLANYKIPKQVVAIDALPRNAMGKVQKNLLRQQFLSQWEGDLSR
jgi:malonyl-CoA/methylmalonyl-CoA synthetase